MKKVPKNAGMNQKEFEQFIFNLNNFGFDLDPEIVPQKYDNLLGSFADIGDDILTALLFYDKIYSDLLDYLYEFRTQTVYYKGIEIDKTNIYEYKKLLEAEVEKHYGLLDEKLYLFKKDAELIKPIA